MKYSEEITEKICKLLKKGNTITTTCEAVGIHKDTFYEWLKKKPDFTDAIKKAQSIADKKVENALFKMATGTFKYIENHYESIIIDKIRPATLKKTIKKTLAPNITAQIFYLKNKQPGEWKDVNEHNVSGQVILKVISAVPRPKKNKNNTNTKKKVKK